MHTRVFLHFLHVCARFHLFQSNHYSPIFGELAYEFWALELSVIHPINWIMRQSEPENYLKLAKKDENLKKVNSPGQWTFVRRIILASFATSWYFWVLPPSKKQDFGQSEPEIHEIRT